MYLKPYGFWSNLIVFLLAFWLTLSWFWYFHLKQSYRPTWLTSIWSIFIFAYLFPPTWSPAIGLLWCFHWRWCFWRRRQFPFILFFRWKWLPFPSFFHSRDRSPALSLWWFCWGSSCFMFFPSAALGVISICPGVFVFSFWGAPLGALALYSPQLAFWLSLASWWCLHSVSGSSRCFRCTSTSVLDSFSLPFKASTCPPLLLLPANPYSESEGLSLLQAFWSLLPSFVFRLPPWFWIHWTCCWKMWNSHWRPRFLWFCFHLSFSFARSIDWHRIACPRWPISIYWLIVVITRCSLSYPPIYASFSPPSPRAPSSGSTIRLTQCAFFSMWWDRRCWSSIIRVLFISFWNRGLFCGFRCAWGQFPLCIFGFPLVLLYPSCWVAGQFETVSGIRTGCFPSPIVISEVPCSTAKSSSRGHFSPSERFYLFPWFGVDSSFRWFPSLTANCWGGLWLFVFRNRYENIFQIVSSSVRWRCSPSVRAFSPWRWCWLWDLLAPT